MSEEQKNEPINTNTNVKTNVNVHRGGEERRRQPNRRGHGQRTRRTERKEVDQEFIENLVCVNRVTKVLKGGRRFSFASLVVVGNKKGKVGYGLGKASDVSESIRKAVSCAKKNIIEVVMYKHTIPYWVQGKSDKSVVLIKPAAPGTGIIAGGAVRIILEMAGYSDILSKSLGSRNSINMIKATFDGLQQLFSPRDISKTRGKTLKNLWS